MEDSLMEDLGLGYDRNLEEEELEEDFLFEIKILQIVLVVFFDLGIILGEVLYLYV